MMRHLWKVDKLPLCVNKLMDGSSNTNQDILDRNTAFDIVKEVRLEQGKASRSTKIVDKKCVIRDVRRTFKDTMKMRQDLEEIQALNSR